MKKCRKMTHGGRDQIDIRTQGEDNKMDAKDIKMLAKKLEKEGDVSLEEAKEITNFFEEKHQELNPDSPTRDKEAADALGLWYHAVEKRLPNTAVTCTPFRWSVNLPDFGNILTILSAG